MGSLGSVPRAVWGQNALGDGRRLDANLQRGSGGRNAVGQTPNFSARNDAITGNVTGLGYFRDDVGYGASGAFGGSLGDDDLFLQGFFQSPDLVPDHCRFFKFQLGDGLLHIFFESGGSPRDIPDA